MTNPGKRRARSVKLSEAKRQEQFVPPREWARDRDEAALVLTGGRMVLSAPAPARLEKNRISARIYRQRRRQKQCGLEHRVKELETENEALRVKVSGLSGKSDAILL